MLFFFKLWKSGIFIENSNRYRLKAPAERHICHNNISPRWGFCKVAKQTFYKYFVPLGLRKQLHNGNPHNLVISTKETRAIVNRRSKSSQVAPERKSNLCRATREDFSFVEMTNWSKNYTERYQLLSNPACDPSFVRMTN